MVLLRADVTANNADDQALLKRFGIFGPPTIAFYGSDGDERSQLSCRRLHEGRRRSRRAARAAINPTS